MAGKKTKLFALCLSAALLLGGCGAETPEQGSEAEPEASGVSGQVMEERAAADRMFSVNYDPDAGLNPIRAESGTNMQFCSLMYDSVFTVDTQFHYSSELVTDVNTTDYVWWVFQVNTDIPFTDGSTLTARDIVYSIQRAQQSSYYQNRLSVIYGISAMGEDCFAITTKYADYALPARLNIPVIKDGSNGEDVPAGSGPYRLAESGDRLILFEENRHAAEMPLDTVYLKSYMDTAEKISAFEASLLDIVSNDPTGMYDLGYGSSNETRYYDTTNLHYIGFNMQSSFFQSNLCRYAVNYALDRDYLADTLLGGCAVATSLPVLPSSEFYDSEYASKFVYDPEKASALFEAGNVRDHDNDGKLEFLVTGIVVEINIDFIVNNNSAAKVQEARQLAETLNSIGITTTLRELSWADYMDALEKGNFDMYYGEVRLAADWDLSFLFEEYDGNTYKFDKNGKRYLDVGSNYARCLDSSYCDLYRAYLAADDTTRVTAFRDACRYVTENGGIVPICFEKRQVLTHRGTVSGLTPTQYDLFYNFKDWTIDLK